MKCNLCYSLGIKNTHLKKIGAIENHNLIICDNCKTQMIYPQPSDDVLSNIYKKEYYNAWGMQQNAELVRKLKISTFSRLFKYLGRIPKNTNLLDIGAATGFLMEYAKSCGIDPYGIEISEIGTEYIAKTFGKDHVFRGQIENFELDNFAKSGFDIITMIDLIEHVRDPISTLKKAYDLLLPDGKLLIVTPNTNSLSRLLMGKYWANYKLEHLYYFNQNNLVNLLERLGYKTDVITKPRKTLNLQYINNILTIYPILVITPIINLFYRLMPKLIKEKFLSLHTGDMLIIASKPA